MKKTEFKKALFALLQETVEGLSFEERMQCAESGLVDFQKENEDQRDVSNKNQKWTDEELRIILSDAATKRNCLKYAKIFHRGYGSIEQIYGPLQREKMLKKSGRTINLFYKSSGLRKSLN